MRVFLFGLLFCFSLPLPARELPLHLLRLPPGFSIQLFHADVPGARSLAVAGDGTVFVSTRGQGKVYALRDINQNGTAEQRFIVAEGLDTPNGIALDGKDLYVAETSRIIKFSAILDRLADPPAAEVLRDELPEESHHGWRYLRLGPDGKLYVAIGAPCNVCDEAGYAEIKRLNRDGSKLHTYAAGVRNSVGFDWHPQTGELWFTDNGRDWLGDDLPPDELNHATKPGQHFGFPYCHGGDIPDPEFGDPAVCREYRPPAAKLGAHVAALGMRFYTGKQFPAEYQQQIFIAEHGSWNRSSKVGYRISLIKLQGSRVVSYQPFATGWLQDESAWGRPVDVAMLGSGSLLVSDDKMGVVYLIRYHKNPG